MTTSNNIVNNVNPNENRVRFQRNVPNSLPINSSDRKDAQQNIRVRRFWHYWEDGERRLHSKSNDIVSSYAPLQWQPLLFDAVELLFKHAHRLNLTLNKKNVHYDPQATSSTSNTDDEDDDRCSQLSTASQLSTENFIKASLICCLLIGLYLFAYTIILKFVLLFILPYYTSLNLAYCFFQWKWKLDGGVFVKNDITKLLLYYCSIDLLLHIFVYFTVGTPSVYVELSILHILPLVTFLNIKQFAGLIINESPLTLSTNSLPTTTTATTPMSELDGWYFLLLFTLRLFGCKGFSLAPWYLRPFVAYSSVYLALLSMETLVHKQTNNLNVTTMQNNSIRTPGLCSCCNNRTNISNHVENTVGRSPNSMGHSPLQPKVIRTADQEQYQQQPVIRHSSLPSSSRALRRGSLPAGSLYPIKTQTNLSEARGLVAELLSQKDLPPNTVTGLKALMSLLNPSHGAPTVYDLLRTLPLMVDTPFIGDQLSLSDSLSARRTSPVTFSTVTSATGLPTLEPEPNRPRSSSYWKQKELEEQSQLTQLEITEEETSKEFLNQKSNVESTDSLLQVAYFAFRQSHLFDIFKIPRQKCFNYFHALEQGYWHIPYHNSIHASDVLHASFYFTMNPVAAVFDENGDSPRALSSVLSSLELLALYTSAAMHDYDHPGKTNAFLVATGDSKAILYNDRSVLENHHAAAAWKLLTMPQNNFIENLDAAEYKRFRYIVMEAILATDLKRHFEILMEFNEKSGRGLDWENESDKLLVIQTCIKMADINSPTKPFDLHIQWTNRILEEFYAQGDAEREHNLPVSAYMDRNEPQVAKLQDSFIAHLVKPLAQAMHSAGLLPEATAVVGDGEHDDDRPTEEHAEDVPPELIVNLEENHKYWKNQLGGGDAAVGVTSSSDDVDNVSDSGNEMATIEEDEDENL